MEQGDFDYIAFEKADIDNNVNYFNELKARGFENDMKFHRNRTFGIWEWKNYDAWVRIVLPEGPEPEPEPGPGPEKTTLPSPFLPYPRVKYEGNFNDYYENEYQEEKATIEYFKLNKARSIEAVKLFVDTNEIDGNRIIDVLKELSPEKIKVAYWGYEEIFKAYTHEDYEKRIKVIGNILNDRGKIDMMRMVFYLFSWDLQYAPIAIKGFVRVEDNWSGIGGWLA